MVEAGAINDVVQQFVDAFHDAGPQLEQLATYVFYSLAVIQMAISGFVFAMSNDTQKATADIIKLLFIMGCCYGLILNGHSLLLNVLNGFIEAGSTVSGMNSISPSGVASQGFTIGVMMFKSFSGLGWITHPLMVLITAFLMLMIVFLYVLITAELVVVIIKTYLLVCLGGFFAAFGVNESVRAVTVNYLKSFLGCGLQLFTLYFLIGVGVKFGDSWSESIRLAAEKRELIPFLVIAGCVLLLYKLVTNIPPFVAQMSGIHGFRSHGDETIAAATAGAAQGAGAMAKVATAGASGAKALGQAGMLGYMGGKSTGLAYQAGASVKGAIAHGAASAAGSIGQAAKSTMKGEGKHMSFGQKANANMKSKVSSQKASMPDKAFKPNGIKK